MPAAATIETEVLLLQVIGAVFSEVRVRPFSISVTSSVPFFILIEPSRHSPDTA